MARNAIESDFRSSKMAAGSYFVKKSKKRKAAYLSEMAINAIKSDFRSSKMAAGGHFGKKKLRIYLKWREMRSKVIFGHPKWQILGISPNGLQAGHCDSPGIMSDWKNFQNSNIRWSDCWSENDSETKCQMEQ